MKICIIGAGVCGLVAAKHCTTNNFQFEILEARNDLGGTWLYSENVGFDEYGYKIFSNLYSGLRTNLPKEIMYFSDYQHKPNRSYITAKEVLQYIQGYADKYRLKPYIKFNRLVNAITPLGSKWLVSSIDKPSQKEITNEYDTVIICTGIYNNPVTARLSGIEFFKGKQMHSNDYRTPDIFKNLNILVIGEGPSGKDVVMQSQKIAKHIVLSHHNKMSTFQSTQDITIKPDVKKILENGTVEFEDETTFLPDYIVYCTGYKIAFDFLTPECGLTVGDYNITPLYKYIININHPSMCIIGLPKEATTFRVFDMQCKFYMKYLNGEMHLPSKEEMVKDAANVLEERQRTENRPFPKSTLSFIVYQWKYFDELAIAANLEKIAPVIENIWSDVIKTNSEEMFNFKNYNYTIVDNENFSKIAITDD